MARPTLYDTDIADKICEELCEGKSLRSICLSEDMPCRSTVFRWLHHHEEFSHQYARAREEQAECLADEIINIADEAEDAALGRLQVDARKWVSSKLKPKKFGDRVTTEHTGSVGVTDLTGDQLDQRINAMLEAAKNAG